MIDMQKRILDRIEKELTGYSLAVKFQYANSGKIFVFKTEDDLIPYGEIGFMFDSGNYTLRLTVDGRKIPSQPGRADYFDFYQTYSETTRFWTVLKKHLPVPTDTVAALASCSGSKELV